MGSQLQFNGSILYTELSTGGDSLQERQLLWDWLWTTLNSMENTTNPQPCPQWTVKFPTEFITGSLIFSGKYQAQCAKSSSFIHIRISGAMLLKPFTLALTSVVKAWTFSFVNCGGTHSSPTAFQQNPHKLPILQVKKLKSFTPRIWELIDFDYQDIL